MNPIKEIKEEWKRIKDLPDDDPVWLGFMFVCSFIWIPMCLIGSFLKEKKPNQQKELFCPKCKVFPAEIKEKYLDALVEIRKWNEKNWELVRSNIDSIEYEQFCGKCGTKLMFKEEK